VLKLLVILTRPLNKGTSETPLHVKFLQDYKEVLSTQDVFITLMSIMMDAVSVNERTETQINEIETQILRIEAEPPRISEGEPQTQETQQVVDEKMLEWRKEESERQASKERKRQKEAKRAEIRMLSVVVNVHIFLTV